MNWQTQNDWDNNNNDNSCVMVSFFHVLVATKTDLDQLLDLSGCENDMPAILQAPQ
jgi:hypothetical protein